MKNSVAIVGMACQYPDASSPGELWNNALSARRAFRAMPSVRMNAEDYLADDRSAPDRTYVLQAAVIENYEFDRVKFRVAGNTFRQADLAHWLALDVASRAVADAGYPEGEGLPKESTGVLLGNTLTGEFSRANLMRLRWPYVRRVLEQELIDAGWPQESRAAFLQKMEGRYKSPFPPIGEESLAGGLSNTIAGRICNYFDLKGGGYTVDGACASSLLAVANACSSLAIGDLDVALAGGVDLSLDPFEIIGFAKTGALAADRMRVYDARSAGFWPGEGCGFVVLMRHEDAVAQGKKIYGIIRGWGISSDGSGGITRPEVDGQILALDRAYRRAGFGVETVTYFEGHGTGTNVGDATELQTLSKARKLADPSAPPAAIGSVKAIIGHTKAAAGVAGLIKATLALHNQILPPTVGCETPHPVISTESPALRPLAGGMLWPEEKPLRAGVSAMGFGGINTHVVLEGSVQDRRMSLTPREEMLLRSVQDVELFLFGDRDRAGLLAQVEHVATVAPILSRAELGDLADRLQHDIGETKVRAAIVASTPAELTERLGLLRGWLEEGITNKLDQSRQVYLGAPESEPRIGFLFPGQGSPAHLDGGIWSQRFDAVRKLYENANLPTSGDGISTDVAQPAIATASLAALRVLERLGIVGSVAVGHSLGELAALHWGGAYDEAALLRIARVRGRAMADLGTPTGTMASIAASADEVSALIEGEPVVIAGLNSPRQTVISGEAVSVKKVVERAQGRGLHATTIPVSHAFHSPLVAAAAEPLATALAGEQVGALRRKVVSTVTGGKLDANADIREVLFSQITSPVRFIEAIGEAAKNIDLLIETGPGGVLGGLAGSFIDLPVVSLDAGGSSLKGLMQALGTAFALGADLLHRELFADRYLRPIDLNRPRRFFENPCEQAPIIDGSPSTTTVAANGAPAVAANGTHGNGTHGNGAYANGSANGAQPAATMQFPAPPAITMGAEQTAPAATASIDVETGVSALDLVRRLVAQQAELPPSAVNDDYRLLGDLHLNSITISQIVVEAARGIGLPAPAAPSEFANATVLELAEALEALRSTSGEGVRAPEEIPAGVELWVRSYIPELVETPLVARAGSQGEGSWQVIASDDHPLAASLRTMLKDAGGNGVVVCLPATADEESIDLLLKGAEGMRAGGSKGAFILAQQGRGAAAFARTLHLERPSHAVSVVDLPFDHPNAARWIVDEARSASGYSEAYYDEKGIRRSPVLGLLHMGDEGDTSPLSADDLLLVTGGGKGIAAEAALELAREYGVALALLGRSLPERDQELAANLARMTDAGVEYRYIATDVTDAAAVDRAIRQAEKELGRPVTAFLHGAGANVPQLIDTLDRAAFRRTLAPKLDGARNVLAALDPNHLRLFIAFSSIIGRAGLKGEADYALANQWLTHLVEEWDAGHPHCRCISMEWSVWSGIGMGEKLGTVENLLREGISPITPEIGLATMKQLLTHELPATAVVISGRTGKLPTARLVERELPLLRFLEQPRVHYAGVELIAESVLTVDTDPYVLDHMLRGQRIFPAVLGLEAFAQVAAALTGGGGDSVVTFEGLRFDRPIIVPEDGSTTVRVAAVVDESGRVDLALRSEETAFQTDHFRTTCRLGGASAIDGATLVPPPVERIDLDPDSVMYRDILFQRGRFHRVLGYRKLTATECIAEVRVDGRGGWFSQYLPGELLLGDPGVRDATMHAIQGCIPHRTILPVAVDRLTIATRPASGVVFVHARERMHEGGTYLYDVEVRDEAGTLYERWEGLLLRAVERNRQKAPWGLALLAPYVERRLGELVPSAHLSVAIDRNADAERRERSDLLLKEMLGAATIVHRRSDGKPEVLTVPLVEEMNGSGKKNGKGKRANGKSNGMNGNAYGIIGNGTINISVAHAGELTLAVAGEGTIGCDLEPVLSRSASLWSDLLGEERFRLAGAVAEAATEDADTAATRIWAAVECLKKTGLMLTAPLVLDTSDSDGWVMLKSGPLAIGTYVEKGRDEALVLAVALDAGVPHD